MRPEEGANGRLTASDPDGWASPTPSRGSTGAQAGADGVDGTRGAETPERAAEDRVGDLEPDGLFGVEEIPRRPAAPRAHAQRRERPTDRPPPPPPIPVSEYRRRLAACGNSPHMVDTVLQAYRKYNPDAPA